MTEQELFAALNLTYPGLEAVSYAVGNKEWDEARAAFAAYLRGRVAPKWHFDGRAPLVENVALDQKDIRTAQDALQNCFTVIEISHRFANGVDWKFNPTTQPGSIYAENREWTWQLSRHWFWGSMGRTYHVTKNEGYAEAFVAQMLDWVQANPVPTCLQQGAGSRWRTIEAGIRMGQTWPNAFFYFLSSPEFTDEAITTMVGSMVEHARYLSQPETGGNWLTMEMNGLFHVGALFPEFAEAEGWRRFAAERMRLELDRQVYPDGAQFELTPGYHNVALRNFLGIVNVAKLNNYDLPAGYLERLESMYEFNLYLMTPSGSLPSFNDSAGGDAVGVLAKGHQLFPERKDFLLGHRPRQKSYQFPYAGYLVQRSGWDETARYLAFDVGPFGYGHQHEDKLNFVLSAYGRDLVVDAGTFSYDNSKWRSYVRSAYAHNVAFVDGLGQNRRGKRETYVTDTPCDYHWELTSEYEYAQGIYGGEFEGFGANPRWVATHKRSILFVKEGEAKDFWVVLDTFIPRDEASHLYETIFHLDAPELHVDQATQSLRTLFPQGANLGIFPLVGKGQRPVKVIFGQEDPFVQGWMRIGHREVKAIPTPTFSVEGEGVQTMLYVFYPFPEPNVPEVSVSPWKAGPDKDAGTGAQIKFADGRIYRVFLPAAPEHGENVIVDTLMR